MLSTLEVRWFSPGDIPPAILTWFLAAVPEAQMQDDRIDRYLILPGNYDLGIKLRENKLEIKQRFEQHGPIHLHPTGEGLLESWVKWSFELTHSEEEIASSIGIHSDWIDIKKQRHLAKFRLENIDKKVEKQIINVPAWEIPSQGVAVELTTIELERRLSWSLAFESFGLKDFQMANLALVADNCFRSIEPPPLSIKDSYSYPNWLNNEWSRRNTNAS